MSQRFFPFSSGVKSITPEMAGWQYSGLQVISIPAGKTDISRYFSGDIEAALIPLSLQNFKVSTSENEYLLIGRSGVFVGASDWVYVASNEKVEISTDTAGEVAIATASVKSNFPSRYVAKISKVEIRGVITSTAINFSASGNRSGCIKGRTSRVAMPAPRISTLLIFATYRLGKFDFTEAVAIATSPAVSVLISIFSLDAT